MPEASQDPARYRRLLDLLGNALDLPAAARAAWVDALSGDNAEFREPLRRLLSHQSDTRGQAAIDGGAVAMAALIDEPATPAFAAGQQIGEYTLERPLGEGGMGVVWLARRHGDSARPPVAIKIPTGFGHGPAAADRLSREGAILASLNHPNIARLIEVGATAEGSPFLVLEFVDGLPLPAFCDARSLNVEARLALFVQVLDAVAYAHAMLVLHRDLKPANVLVTQNGEIKLLDFGIAKLIDDSGNAASTQLTRLAGRAFTPDFASPEQIAGETLTVASDIYSLGVMLFHLLTGERPYKLKRGSAAELEEAILSADTGRPSAVVTEAFAARNMQSTRALRRVLAGDIDTIVLKALKKSRADRYGSVLAFKDDIERYLKGQPVLATPDSSGYRLKKFLLRNRFTVAATTAVFVALVVGLAGALWQAGVAREQARVAKQEAARAEAVKEFLVSLFRKSTRAQADPVKARNMSVQELLQESVPRVRAALSDQPQIKMELLSTIGEILADLDQRQSAYELFAEADQLLRAMPSAPLDTQFSVLQGFATSAMISGKRDDAVNAYRRLMALAEPPNQPGEQLKLRIYSTAIGSGMVDFAEEVARLRKGLAIAESSFANTPLHFNVVARLAMIHASNTRWPEALSFATRAVELFPASGSVDYQQYLQVRGALGIAMATQGRLREAISHLQDTLAEFDRRYGSELPRARFFRSVHANLLAAHGRTGDAARVFERLIGEFKPGVAPTYSQLSSLGHVALMRRDMGDLPGAVASLTRFPGQLKLMEAEDRIAAMNYALVLATAAELDGQSARADEMLALIDRFNEGKTATFLKGNFVYRTVAARIYLLRGDHGRARDALGFNGNVFGPDAPVPAEFNEEFIHVSTEAVELFRQAGEHQRARDTALRAIKLIEGTTTPADYPFHYASLLQVAGKALAAQQDYAGCVGFLEKAVGLQQAHHVAGSPWLMQSRLALAECELQRGQAARAATLVKAVRVSLRGQSMKLPAIAAKANALDSQLAGSAKR